MGVLTHCYWKFVLTLLCEHPHRRKGTNTRASVTPCRVSRLGATGFTGHHTEEIDKSQITKREQST